MLLSLFSCTKDIEVVEKTQGNISFKIAINQEKRLSSTQKLATSSGKGLKDGAVAIVPPVLASDFTSSFSAGDTVGLFIVPAGEALSSSNATYRNVQIIFDGQGWSGNVNWPAEGGLYDFYAYYPYSSAAAGGNSKFEVQSDQSTWANFQKSDLMVAKSLAVAKGSTVPLNFSHLMSMVQVNVGANAGKSQNPDKDMVVSLAGIKSRASYSLNDQAATGTESYLSNIKMYRVEQAGDANYNTTFTYRALLPAQDLSAKSNRLVFSQGNQTFVRAQDTKLTLTTGTAHHITQPALDGLWQAVWVEPGIFQMGSPESDVNALKNEKPQHWVRLTKGFYMSKYAVTVEEYAQFLNAVSAQPDAYKFVYLPFSGERITLLQPVGNGGYPFFNYTDGKWQVKNEHIDMPVTIINFKAAKAYAHWAGGELPTEAQWEYACRAGTTTVWSFGKDPNDLNSYVWYGLTGSYSKKVGLLAANPWGLYDMHGNVAEYCLPNGNYPSQSNTPQTAIVDPVEENAGHTLRGGSFKSTSSLTRSAVRDQHAPTSAGNITTYNGFRIIKYR
ncbi:SUMF1/EgtB/PvdO family nonheme iron enzyme [Sphingobacterium sp. UT-1RO-CII-1]|nr:SUMF1/EgtB/PvdO family nonheme iron enzyme [Sphingobacterium sp. UT-1RO-CII-1]